MENEPSVVNVKSPVKVYNLGIGEQDKEVNALVSMEMHDTQKIGFRRKSTRRRSIDKIFQKVERLDIEPVSKSALHRFPRRSCADSKSFSFLRENRESDEEEPPQNSGSVEMLDLRVGEQNPQTNSLVALEMQDTKETGFRRGNRRRKSVDKIFNKYDNIILAQKVDRSKLTSIPRRSLTPTSAEALHWKNNESDSEDNENQEEEKPISVQMLQLNIGETEESSKSLVALEMHDTKKTGFRRNETGRRRKSIDRIFSKVNSVNVDSDVDPSILKREPRRSISNDINLSKLNDQNRESDSELDE